MFIILMRHSIAVEKKDNVDEETRELTEKGRKKLMAVAEGIKKILPDPIVLHSSPLTRAFQSAEIVSSVFDQTPIHLSDDLANGNYKEFFSHLSDEPIHLSIGHEPYLSEWLYELTGVKQAFKKASFALIEIKDNTVIQFICYAKLNNIKHFNERLEWFELLHQWLELIQTIDLEPMTEIKMHQYRILLRSFDTLIYSTKKQHKIIIPAELESLVGTLIDQTNTIREIDVLISELEKDNGIVQLIQPLKDQRELLVEQWKKERKETLEKHSLEIMLFGLMIQYDQSTQKKSWIQSRFNHLIELVGKKLITFDMNQDIDIHDTRLLMKKVVYMAKYHSKYINNESKYIGELAQEIKNFSGIYLDYKKHWVYLNQLSHEYPTMKHEIEAYQNILDSKVPSTFAIHQMIYKFSKKIGVK
jgi:phosphohistidine phosphatase